VLSYPIPPQSDDLTDGEPLASFTLAQAVHASARFPYISPAETIERAGVTWGHLVDGGYFENSGAVTAKEILDEVAAGQVRTDAPAAPVATANSAALCVPPQKSTARVIIIRYCEKRQHVARWATELTAPPAAFFAARDARGRLAVNTLKRAFADERTDEKNADSGSADGIAANCPEAGDVAEFCLEPGDPPLPLGWMLSDSAQAQIDEQAKLAIARVGCQVSAWLHPNAP